MCIVFVLFFKYSIAVTCVTVYNVIKEVLKLKIRVNYSIDEEVKQEFDQICKENSINKSAWIEQRIKEFIEQKKKEVK